jgi:hypothetical protein
VYALSVLEIHDRWSWVVVVGNGLAGVWALGAHWAAALRTRWLWVLVTVAQLAVAVQVVLGVVLISVQDMEAPEFHVFYGFVSLISVGIIYSYRSQLTASRYLLYGGGCLFLMGLGIRAMFLA